MDDTERFDFAYLCDWLPPDFGAVGQYAVIFARQAAAAGSRVVLIGLTSGDGAVHDEVIGCGLLRTVRIASPRCEKAKLGARIRWTLRTNTVLVRRASRYVRRADRLVFTGSPPLILNWIAPANLLWRKPLTYQIMDFHPECLIAERGHAGPGLRLALALTRFWRRRIERFEVLGHDQAERLRQSGIADARIRHLALPPPVQIRHDTEPLARPGGSENRVLLLYSGTLGTAHDEATFRTAYVRHHREGRGSVLLWLNAVGEKAEALRRGLREAAVPFIDGAPVGMDVLANLLVTPDAHLVTLRDSFVGYVMPSKVVGCIATGRPVIYVGSAASDVHRLCIEAGLGFYRRVDVGASERLAAVLDSLADHVRRRRATGADRIAHVVGAG